MADIANSAEGLTAAIVARGAAWRLADVPSAVRLVAKQCVLDWLGVTLAGGREPVAAILRSLVRAEGGHPVATLIGGGGRVSARQAALVNGSAGHALDYDDANVAAQGHVTAAVLPAAFALAEARQLAGDALLRAFVAGYETAGMVGQYVGRAHYDHGFHGTGTVGAVAAAAAAASLLELDAAATARAFGIAATQAAGLKAQFGTMCKPFHAGRAAENGVLAAQLAGGAFGGREDILEAAQGFGAVTSPDRDPARALAEPPGGQHLLSNLFKYHAACLNTHAAIDLVASLRERHRLDPRQVRRVEIRTHASNDRICNIAEPRTGLQAKFSLRFTAALALSGAETAAPATFSDANARDPALCALRDRVTVVLEDGAWPLMRAEVTIETLDGLTFTDALDGGVPIADLPEQGRRLQAKFESIVTPLWGPARTRRIVELVDDLDNLPSIGVLMEVVS